MKKLPLLLFAITLHFGSFSQTNAYTPTPENLRRENGLQAPGSGCLFTGDHSVFPATENGL